jgi:hypothetical protein
MGISLSAKEAGEGKGKMQRTRTSRHPSLRRFSEEAISATASLPLPPVVFLLLLHLITNLHPMRSLPVAVSSRQETSHIDLPLSSPHPPPALNPQQPTAFPPISSLSPRTPLSFHPVAHPPPPPAPITTRPLHIISPNLINPLLPRTDGSRPSPMPQRPIRPAARRPSERQGGRPRWRPLMALVDRRSLRGGGQVRRASRTS